jgi:hypothetical protein
MKNIASVADLKDAISELEFNKAVHRRMLKDSFNSTIESLKPWNVIKNISSAIISPSLFANILPAAVGMGAGYISNRITNKITNGSIRGSRLKRALISLALYGVTKAVIRNPGINRMFGQRVFNSVFSK